MILVGQQPVHGAAAPSIARCAGRPRLTKLCVRARLTQRFGPETALAAFRPSHEWPRDINWFRV